MPQRLQECRATKRPNLSPSRYETVKFLEVWFKKYARQYDSWPYRKLPQNNIGGFSLLEVQFDIQLGILKHTSRIEVARRDFNQPNIH